MLAHVPELPRRSDEGRTRQAASTHPARALALALADADADEDSTPGHTYGWLASLAVLTVTGVPRRVPRPWGRIVSPERELHELSLDPWRPTSFRVMVTAAGTEGDAMRPQGEGVRRRLRDSRAAQRRGG